MAEKSSSARVILVLCLCGTAAALQQTILVPLLPQLPRLLGTTAANASWLVTVTLLSGAVATPVITRLADLHGKRRMLLTALAAMMIGAVVGSVFPTLIGAIVARALQGMGLALIPTAIATLRDELPPHRVSLGISLMSATMAIGAGLGMPLSGLIASQLPWQAIFWVTGLTAAVMAVLVFTTVRPGRAYARGSFDWPGTALLSAALVAGLLVLSKGPSWGFLTPTTLILLVGTAVLLAIWIPVELRRPSPLVDLRTASRPAVLMANTASVLLGLAMMTNMLTTSLVLQAPRESGYGLGLDLLTTGLWMAPTAIAFGATAPVSSLMLNSIGAQTTLLIGASVMALGFWTRALTGQQLWQVVLASTVIGVGTSLTFAAMPALVMASVPLSETASANGLNTLLRSVGTSCGSALLAAFTTATALPGAAVPSRFGAEAVLVIAGCAAALAALLAFLMRRLRS
ncbi:MFS transporter [Enemella evansiae]|uniref:MFS transporter n=1 Tax=Enemella evansiae TaxID=2016499 RepID=UPI000B97C930|nr:MFS transporter [Enemella evansiae]OYO11468.1 MFS transporter [Enemella evansiae]TDO88111.1 MFS transporter [Enemella evansiae]